MQKLLLNHLRKWLNHQRKLHKNNALLGIVSLDHSPWYSFRLIFLLISDIVQIFFPIDPCFSLFLSQILSSSLITRSILFYLFFSGEITSQYLMNFSLRTQISLGMWTLASQVTPKYLYHYGFWNFNEGLYVK